MYKTIMLMKILNTLTFQTVLVLIYLIGVTTLASAQGKVNLKDGPLKEKDWLANPGEAALNESHANVKTWIKKWYGPDGNYENNGGFPASAPKDLIEDGTKGKLTQPKLSTVAGLQMTQNVDISWPKANGGPREWTVFELEPADGNNMNRDGPVDNIDTYGIIVINAPKAMKAVMSPAHDDHAQIWINGEKWYNNSAWTGAATQVDYNIEVDLQKGANVLLYRVGESGGSAYINLHFDDETHKATDIYPQKANDQKSFFDEVAGVLDVDPVGKLATTWADIKQER